MIKLSGSVLRELYRECSVADWDGRDAAPISEAAIIDAVRVASQLPERYPVPEIIPIATGDVGFEWYIDPYRVLSLSVAGDGYIYYAGLFGFKNADHGSKPLAGKLNEKVMSLLGEVYK